MFRLEAARLESRHLPFAGDGTSGSRSSLSQCRRSTLRSAHRTPAKSLFTQAGNRTGGNLSASEIYARWMFCLFGTISYPGSSADAMRCECRVADTFWKIRWIFRDQNSQHVKAIYNNPSICKRGWATNPGIHIPNFPGEILPSRISSIRESHCG
jgi:hypothetical protein